MKRPSFAAPGIVLASLLFLSFDGQTAAQVAAAQKPELKVRYTGRLFGYFRIEAEEENPSSPKLAPVKAFLELNAPDAHSLLLGMGDNFGPEFGASIQQGFNNPAGHDGPCSLPTRTPTGLEPRQWHNSVPESLYKTENRLPKLADCDNVTRFLMTAGYRAVVPGREDFLYTATWLRRIAYLLRGWSTPGAQNAIDGTVGSWSFTPYPYEHRRLHLLSANIRVAGQAGKKGAGGKGPGGGCPLLLGTDMASPAHPCLPDLSKTQEMDWFQRLDAASSPDPEQRGQRNPVAKTIERQADKEMVFRQQLVVNEASVLSGLLEGYCGKAPDELKPFTLQDDKPGSAFTIVKDPDGKESLSLRKTLKSTEAGTAGMRDPNALLNSLKTRADTLDPAPDPKCELALDATNKFKATGLLSALLGATVDMIRNAVIKPGTPGAPHQYLVSNELLRTARDLFALLIYSEQNDVGFTIAHDGKRKVLIVGVTGQETMQAISKNNLTVFPTDPDCPGWSGDKQVCELKKAVLDRISNKNQFDGLTGYGVEVIDPHIAVTDVIRAVAATCSQYLNPAGCDSVPFDSVVVMAQMPQAEAEELAARVVHDLKASAGEYRFTKKYEFAPKIDLVVSEGVRAGGSPDLDIYTHPGTFPPVLEPPDPTNELWSKDEPNVPMNEATLLKQASPNENSLSRLLTNRKIQNTASRAASKPDACTKAEEGEAACRLETELENAVKRPAHGKAPGTSTDKDLSTVWNACNHESSCMKEALMQYLLRQIQESSNADLVFMERRDFYFDRLGEGYNGYELCDNGMSRGQSTGTGPDSGDFQIFYGRYCRLKVALDRVLWKGDLAERVMVDGATIESLMKKAKQETDQDKSLLAHDTYEEWLVTFGITSKPPENLVTASSGPSTFFIPGMDGCNGAKPGAGGGGAGGGGATPGPPGTNPDCIDGQSILNDHAYWVSTSDHVAHDQAIYTDLSGVSAKPGYDQPYPLLYVTSEIADQIARKGQSEELKGKNPDSNTAESMLGAIELRRQERNLVQVDFSKVITGFTILSPSLPDATIGQDLSGVSNTQAVTPHSQELDLEVGTRLSSAPINRRFVLGAQHDLEYDRKVQGNITGNPETVTYSANSYTIGGFAEMAIRCSCIPGLGTSGLNQSTRNLPRAFFVVSPYQYQRQITGAILNFPFFTPPSTSNPQNQVSVHIPNVTSFSQRGGFRFEFGGLHTWSPDPGSYFEAGPEYTVQNNILSALQLPQLVPELGAAKAVCDVSATQSLQTCVKNAYKTAGVALDSKSAFTPVTETLHAGGVYWMAHLQKALSKQYSASFDTQGDSYFLPGVTLPTQTGYALSTKVALNFNLIGNLSLAPTWTEYFFENQGSPTQRTALVATTFTITAKWYFARDAQVPFHRQIWFAGPQSSDQTASAKVK